MGVKRREGKITGFEIKRQILNTGMENTFVTLDKL